MIDALSQLVGMTCAAGALAFVAALTAVWLRRYVESFLKAATDR